jgi:glutathione S-transferase
MPLSSDPPTPEPTLVGRHSCPYVDRVRLYLHETRIPCRYVVHGDDPELDPKSVTPTGKVPFLKVGRHVLFESLVILGYLDETNSRPWLPPDPLSRARCRSWMTFADDLHLRQACLFDAESADGGSAAERYGAGLAALDAGLEQEAGLFAGPGSLVRLVYAPLMHRLSLADRRFRLGLLARHARVAELAAELSSYVCGTGILPADFEERYIEHLMKWPGYLRSRGFEGEESA